MRGLILYFFICSSFAVHAQQFVNYGIENGLVAKYIYDISQNQQLNLMLATEKGLIKFDGFSYESVLLPDQNARSYISKLFRTQSGQLYVGNSIGEVWRESQNDFHKINLPESANSQVINFYEDNDGFIWICTKTTGIFKYDPRMNESMAYLIHLNDQIINSFEGITRKSFLIGTNEGLFYCREKLNKELEIISRVESIPNSKITYVQKQQDYWWVGTNDRGLFKIALKDSDEIEFEITNSFQDLSLENYSIRSAILKDEGIYIATSSNGLLKIVNNQKIEFGISENLASENLYCLYSDHEKNLWIGTFGKGLSRKVSSSFIPFNEINPVTDPVFQLEFDKNQMIIAGINGLSVYSEKDGKWILIEELKGKHINTFCLVDDLVYFNEVNVGLHVSDRNFKNVKLYLKHEDINHVSHQNQQIYISTSTQGLIVLNDEGYYKYFNTNNGLTHNEVLNSFMDKDGVIWLAMSGGVLNSIEDSLIQIYGTEQGLHPFDFTSFTQDKFGNIWIASDGGGIYKYNGITFENFNRSAGIHTNYILSIAEYGDCIIAGGKNAISILKRGNESEIRSINTKEDLYDFSIYTNGLKHGSDKIWMMTDKGLFTLKNFMKDKEGALEANTYFTQILINDSLYSDNQDIELPYGSYRIELNYRISCLDNPEDVRYKYFVEGLESDYGKAFSESSCYYPGLGPGDYTFYITSSGCDGSWNTEPLTLSVSIDRPIYQKPWFIILTALVFVGIVFMFIQYRERANKKIQKYLSDQLNIRTAEVRKQKDELAIKNKEIQDSIVYAERIQKSMLSNEKVVEVNAKDYFIFYRPRDIVSGDFYWFHETGQHFFFAGADCTGHGVPGSMMSMICISELDKEININQQTEPQLILKKIDISIRQTLHKNEQEQTNDGMDIALCVLDKKSQVVKFSGASRPCYVVQNDELKEFKGTRAHIGGAEREEKEFEQHEILLNGRSRFYLTSDGFVDQFGGEKGKKFMRKNFRTLVNEAQSDPMSKQQLIFMEAFMSWKGHLEQVDDVLVMGIEF